MPHTIDIVFATALTVASLAAEPAAADVLSTAGNGFEIRQTAHSAASPDKVYAALLLPARWWSPDHTFSGNAANLVLQARAGGCWCETLPNGGSVEHMRVLYVSPGKSLRLRGALGPFQAMAVNGVMTFTVTGTADGTDISLSYAVGGYAKDGFDDLAKAADHVLGEQLGRLMKLVDGEPAHAH
jgi:uncharacterized protein YndB with AHSA1/START domain